MTTKDEAKLSMYEAVLDHLLKNPTITENLPNFPALLSSLQQNIASMLKLVQEQNKDKSGITIQKRELHDEIIQRTTDLSGKLMAYATNENDKGLYKLIKFTKSDLLKSTDNDLITHTLEVCDNALLLMDKLPTYNVEKAEVTILQNLCADYLVSIPKPREGLRDTKEFTLGVAAMIKATDEVLFNMDAVMLVIRFSEAAFFNHYTNSRSIVNTGARSLAVKGLITDAVSGKGIEGAYVTFEPVNDDGTKRSSGGGDLQKGVKITAAKGGFSIKTLAAGTYLVTVTKEGYATQTMTLYVSAGELATVTMALYPL
jgi:hypothetical protein